MEFASKLTILKERNDEMRFRDYPDRPSQLKRAQSGDFTHPFLVQIQPTKSVYSSTSAAFFVGTCIVRS